jgi:hypothetical protein
LEDEVHSSLNSAVLKRNAIAYWQQSPLNAPVKLTSLLRLPTFWSEGYVTCHKFIAGRSLSEAERILGLQHGELSNGAYLYAFLRLPTEDEFDTRGYTQTPGGENWEVGGLYPPGAGAAQWEIRKNTHIPTRLLAALRPGEFIP